MANIEKIKVGLTSYDIRDATTLQNLTAAQETQLLTDGTYNGEAVADGTVFTTEDGKFKEFDIGDGQITTFPTPTYVSGLDTSDYYLDSNGNTLLALKRGTTTLYYSEDLGATWNSTTLPAPENYLSSYEGHIFAWSENSTTFYHTTDLSNWDTITVSSSLSYAGLQGIAYKNGVIVVANHGSSKQQAKSTDMGQTWSLVGSSFNAQFCKVVNGYFSCGVVGGGRIYYSEDASTWSQTGTIYGSNASINNLTYYDGNYYVSIAGSQAYCYSSSLSGSFTTVSVGSGKDFQDLVICNNISVGLGYTNNCFLSYSMSSPPPAANSFTVITSGQTGCISITNVGNVVFASGEGIGVYKVDLRGQTVYSLTQLSYDKSEVDTAIAGIPTVTVDQTYNASSANAQSGVAINGAGFLKNTATKSTSISIVGSVSNYDDSIAIGATSSISANYGTTVGSNSSAGYGSAAFGYYTYATAQLATALGCGAEARNDHSTAVGNDAKAAATYAIQIGYGTNSTANTLSVGLSANLNVQLLNSSGQIPAARLGTLPSADGTYVPVLTITSGVPSIAWVAYTP